MTQCDMVLTHLERRGSLTQASAARLFKIFCLAERVRDLRKKGIDVKSEIMKLPSGKSCARYSL